LSLSQDSQWQEVLSEAIRAIGLSYEPTVEDVRDFIKFAGEYELDLKQITNDQDLFPASELSVRWECSPDDLFRSLSSLLPVYLFHKNSQSLVRINDLIRSAMDKLKSSQEPYSWLPERTQKEGNISFAFPWFWVLSARELHFLERLPPKTESIWQPPLILNRHLDVSFEWITWDEILERWNIKNRRLEDFILDLGLAAYWLTPLNGIEAAPDDIILYQGQRGDWFRREQNVLFAREDVWAFEEKYGSGKYRRGKSPRMILRVNPAKLRAVDLILEALRSNPDMTTTEVTPYLREKAPLMFGPAYPTDRTIKEYVKDLTLRVQEGRPRKTRQKR